MSISKDNYMNEIENYVIKMYGSQTILKKPNFSIEEELRKYMYKYIASRANSSGSSQTKDIIKINKQWFNEYIEKVRGNN